MTTRDDRPARFEGLIEEIAATEDALRRRFEDTPAPGRQVLDRIKTRLRAEAARPIHAAKAPIPWPAWASAAAAAVLLAVSAGLYFRSAPQPGRSDLPAGGPPPQASLDAFTASLPTVMEEDPAVRELIRDVQDLETQAANLADEAEPPQPSASGTGGGTPGQDWVQAGRAPACGQEHTRQVLAADGGDIA